jgi:protein SCO1/2
MLVRALMLCLMLACLNACKPQPKEAFETTDIAGADFASGLQLTDHHGKPASLADFKGKVVVLFFGYTHCPDVCPTTMSDLAQAMKLLGKDADHVQVLFVTLDPARDTPEVLAKYVPYFDQRFLGLYGSERQIADTAHHFKISASKQPPDARGNYSIDHSAGTYVYDPQGKIRLYINYGTSAAVIAHDLRLLMS